MREHAANLAAQWIARAPGFRTFGEERTLTNFKACLWKPWLSLAADVALALRAALSWPY